MKLLKGSPSWMAKGVYLAILATMSSLSLEARDFRVAMLPQPDGDRFSCATCHVTNNGGPRNRFGQDVQRFVSPGGRQNFWPQVFDLDSDGDGVSNGRELGDADGDGVQDEGITRAMIFSPADPNSFPEIEPPPPAPEPAAPEPMASPLDFPPVSISGVSQPDEAFGLMGLEWRGGFGPYLIQRKDQLDDGEWIPVGTTDSQNFSVPTPGRTGFFRVDSLGHVPPTLLTAHINGAMERPEPVETEGRGSGNFRVHGDILTFEIHYRGLSGPATRAHIHGPADTTQTGGVLINLEPYHVGAFGTDGVFKGSVRLLDEHKSIILGGRSYVNIHTEAHGPGEIRGQIAPAHMVARLNGRNERPEPVDTNGRGTGLLALIGDQLTMRVDYYGLSGPAVAAHIHGPASRGESAGVMVNLGELHVGPLAASGAYSGTVTLNPQQLGALIDGMTYINIHTQNHGGGEIRGQISPALTPIPLSAYLSGASERPESVTTEATGFAHAELLDDTLALTIRYQGLSGPATGAHIHGPATSAETAGVLINLQPIHMGPFSTDGLFRGRVNLTPEQRQAILSGHTYINIHTEAHGPGEIRGQLGQVLQWASLNGESERPNPVLTMASGTASGAVLGNHLSLNVLYSGLSGQATAAHIHGAAHPEATAGPLIDLQPFNGGAFGVNGRISGFGDIDGEDSGIIIDGMTYINIHTEANGPGEIRGQLLPVTIPQVVLTTSLSGDAERPDPVTTEGTGKGTMTLVGNQLYMSVEYSGLSGPATAAHIHGEASSEGAAGVILNLQPLNGGSFGTSGTFRGMALLEPGQASALRRGATYVNIHTAANASGEIRGQIGPVHHNISLSGDFSRPDPVDTQASGGGMFKLVYDRLLMAVRYDGLSGTASAAHIHGPAGPEETNGILVDLEPFNGGGFGSEGRFTGIADLGANLRGSIIDGRTYINIHTSANPGGEIRGQITRHPGAQRSLIISLTGDQEVPPVTTSATGTGSFTLLGHVLSFEINYAGLSGPVTGAHIHGPAEVGTNAGVLMSLEPFHVEDLQENGVFRGAVALNPLQLQVLLSGRTYVNIHTGANPGGEIRGQISE